MSSGSSSSPCSPREAWGTQGKDSSDDARPESVHLF